MSCPDARARAPCCAASVKLMYAPQPTPEVISALAEHEVRAVACGHNHTLALDTQPAAYTWGALG